jgi:hypothetical protein
MNERLTELCLHYRCEYCLAPPGIWCRTRRGAVATTLHSARSDPIRLAWLDGWHEGLAEDDNKLREMGRSA